MEDLKFTMWYVVFSAHNVRPTKIHTFLKYPFYHCYCFRQIGDYVYFADHTKANINTAIYQDVTANELAHILINENDNLVILRIKIPIDFSNKNFNIWNMLPTCVSTVKMFLGITNKAVTPYQLYRHLLKRGAKLIN
jgi:uncharacterized protein YjaG (DUF416 family)